MRQDRNQKRKNCRQTIVIRQWMDLLISLKSFVGIGIGAGANVMLRYAMSQQRLLDALILINATSQKAGWVEWGYQKWNLNGLSDVASLRHIEECNPDIVQQYHDYFYSYSNTWNLALYIDAFLNDVILRDLKSVSDYLLKVPILQIVGMNSAFISL
uniref:Protein NDRG3 n=1 Tax=Globodera pallida TaxID=36090 RepID=A0A183BXC3_GLOPA